MRNNRGGNIASWIISRLLRKAWFYWNQRVGRMNLWNMQYAFRGHEAAGAADHSSAGLGISQKGRRELERIPRWCSDSLLSHA